MTQDVPASGGTQRPPGDQLNAHPSAIETRIPEEGASSRLFDRFRLEKLLGRGAFGEVWLAWDPRLERHVALKIPVLDDWSSGERRSFLHEARSAASLDHEHIVRVFEVGDETFPWLAVEFIDGSDMRSWIKQERPDAATACRVMLAIAVALQHAHDRQVVHRDLKPENVLVDRKGDPHVADFGLARRESDGQTVSRKGCALGTPAYMSPEQAQGATERVDARSDLYAWGVMFFELLTGEVPFRGSARMMMQQKQWSDPPEPRSLDDRIPADLQTICLKCLAREPERRFQSTTELIDEMNRYLAGEPICSRPLGTTERVWRWCRRRQRIVVPTLSTTLLIVVVVIVAFYQISNSRDAEHNARTQAEGLAEENLRLASQERQARKQAELRFRDARNAIDLWMTFAGDSLRNTLGTSSVRLALLEEAAAFYDRIARESLTEDFELGLAQVRTHTRLGDAQRELGLFPEAETAYRRSEELLAGFATKKKSSIEETDIALERANVQTRLGLNFRDQQQTAPALEALAEAISQLELLRQRHARPDVRAALATAQLNLSVVELESGRSDHAAMLCRASCREFEQLAQDDGSPARRLALTAALRQWARVSLELGQAAVAVMKLEEVAELYAELSADEPGNVAFRELHATILIELASALTAQGNVSSALAAYSSSTDELTQLSGYQPYASSFETSLLLTQINHAALLRDYGDVRAAVAAIEGAERLGSELLHEIPDQPFVNQLLVTLWLLKAQLWFDRGLIEEAKTAVSNARQTLATLPQDTVEIRHLVLAERVASARLLLHAGQLASGRAQLTEIAGEISLEISGSDVSASSSSLRYLALQLAHIADIESIEFPEAATEYRATAIRALTRLPRSWPTPQLVQDLAYLLLQQAASYPEGSSVSSESISRAVMLSRTAATAAPDNRTWRATLGAALSLAGKHEEAVGELEAALALDDKGTSAKVMKSVAAHPRSRFWLAIGAARSHQPILAKSSLAAARQWMMSELPDSPSMIQLERIAADRVSLSKAE